MSVVIDGTTGIETPDLQVGGVSGKPFLGNAQFLTTDKTLTALDTADLLVCSNSIDVTLPAVSEGLVFGFVNASDALIVIATPNPATLVGRRAGGVILAGRQEAIVVCDGVGWQMIGADDTIRLQTVQFPATGTYVPNPAAKLFLACVNGATGGTTNNPNAKGGSGGGGYSEKLYTAPFSPSYAVTVGAAGAVGSTGGTTTFGTISIASSAGAGVTTGTSGAVGTGGDFNATGGTGGNGNTNSSGGGGGGGGSATRAGNGGNGGNGPAAFVSGGGGGTGGNNASGATPGNAATSVSGSAYSLTAFANVVTFDAGPGAFGGSRGAASLNTYSGFGFSFIIGGGTASAGRTGDLQGTSTGHAGNNGHVTIVEIF